MSPQRLGGLCVIALISLVYFSFPTRNHYWDGIGFALAIEDSPGLTSRLFNPNHLFYNFFGYLIYHSIHSLGLHLRALTLLSTLSTLLSVSCAYLLFSMLFTSVRNLYYSVCLTLLFAFSATWWKFSTDANVYVPSVFFLLLIAYKLHRDEQPNALMIGGFHAAAMLLHQIAVFFYPVVLVAMFCGSAGKRFTTSLRDAVRYSAVAASLVIASYIWVWCFVLKRRDFSAFTTWVLSNGREEFAFFSVPHNLLETLRSTVRLFFGGRFSLALNFVEPPFLVILGVLLVCGVSFLVLTVWLARINFRNWLRTGALEVSGLGGFTPVLLTWIGSYLFFLFLWLTQYPYYRLFYLPALILLLGIVLKKMKKASSQEPSFILASFVFVTMVVNFTFLIYPYSKIEATPPVHLAVKASEMWKDDVIYFADFNCDNWIFKYFNKGTTWRPLTLNDLQALREELIYLRQQGQKTWIDTTTLDQMNQSQELATWLADSVHKTVTYGLTDRKHRIQFTQVEPKADIGITSP